MAQFNITLKSEEILEVFARDRNEAFIFLFERILNEILQIESEEQLGASFHERSQDRKDYRNGTRERDLTTRIGRLSLQVHRHRNKPFHTMVFESNKRSEAALITTMVQMVISDAYKVIRSSIA
jgi:putative transposase